MLSTVLRIVTFTFKSFKQSLRIYCECPHFAEKAPKGGKLTQCPTATELQSWCSNPALPSEPTSRPCTHEVTGAARPPQTFLRAGSMQTARPVQWGTHISRWQIQLDICVHTQNRTGTCLPHTGPPPERLCFLHLQAARTPSTLQENKNCHWHTLQMLATETLTSCVMAGLNCLCSSIIILRQIRTFSSFSVLKKEKHLTSYNSEDLF